MSSAAYMTDVKKKSKQCGPNQTAPDLGSLCALNIHKSIMSANICCKRLFAGKAFCWPIWVNIVKLTLKMPLNYQFENVVCYIYLLTLKLHMLKVRKYLQFYADFFYLNL